MAIDDFSNFLEIVLASDFTGCLGRLMKFPTVSNVLDLFQRAIQIRDLPQEVKPIPFNSQVPTLPSDSASTNRAPSKIPSKLIHFEVPKKLVPAPRPQQRATSESRESREAREGEYDAQVEKGRKLQLDLLNMHQMNVVLAEQIQKGIQILHHEV